MINPAINLEFVSVLFVLAAVVFLLYFFIKFRRCHELLSQVQEELRNKNTELTKISNKLQAVQQKFLEKERISFLAHISAGILHQISQPITAIHGFTQFIKKEMNSDDKFYIPISLMEEQSQYLKHTLDDLMELVQSRQAGKEKVNVNDIIEKTMRLVMDELKIRRIETQLQLKDNLPLVYADRLNLQHIFMNLITNAADALSKLRAGYPRVLTITSSMNKTARHIEIFFKDSGQLSDRNRQHIFDPFFSTKKEECGVGLTLCQELITQLNGTLSLESQKEGGTQFVVRLPCANQVNESF